MGINTMSDSPTDGFVPWVLAGIASMVAALTSGITYLARKIANDYAADIKELKERSNACEKDRSDLFAKHSVLEFEVNTLKYKLLQIDANGTEYSHKKDAQ